MKRARSLSVTLLLLLSLLPAHAAQAPVALPGVERITSVEGINEYRLPNGLRVLLFPDPSKPTVTVNITYLVGSKHENYGETGMAHLLEHLLFKGSTKHTNVPKELQDHGSRPNGTTWFDRTNYFETFQASDANLEWALDLEADRMVNSFVAKKDLDSEMTVVRNEYESGENSPMNVLQERVMSAAYLWHNYGKSTIGARSDIENVPIDRLQAFYRNYYQPDNAILLVAGKIDEGKTLGLINRYFGGIPRPQRVLQANYTTEPVQDGERRRTAVPAVAERPVAGESDRQPRRRHQPHAAPVGDQQVPRRRHGHSHPAAFTRRWSKPKRPPPFRAEPTSSGNRAWPFLMRRSGRNRRSRMRATRCWLPSTRLHPLHSQQKRSKGPAHEC